MVSVTVGWKSKSRIFDLYGKFNFHKNGKLIAVGILYWQQVIKKMKSRLFRNVSDPFVLFFSPDIRILGWFSLDTFLPPVLKLSNIRMFLLGSSVYIPNVRISLINPGLKCKRKRKWIWFIFRNKDKSTRARTRPYLVHFLTRTRTYFETELDSTKIMLNHCGPCIRPCPPDGDWSRPAR